MKALEYHTIDKSEWSEGPWKREPDKRQWFDEETGYPCLIERNPVGALFGYVGVPRDHIAYGKQHDVVDEEVKIYGGLTFAGKSPGNGGVYCKDELLDANDVYWFGFNCAHMGDRCPKIELHIIAPRATVSVPSTYRDISYVTEQCHLLAVQLKALKAQTAHKL